MAVGFLPVLVVAVAGFELELDAGPSSHFCLTATNRVKVGSREGLAAPIAKSGLSTFVAWPACVGAYEPAGTPGPACL